MNMKLEDTIYKRQSIRNYNNKKLSDKCISSIRDFIDNSKVLNPNIKWSYDIVGVKNIKTVMPWKSPYYLIIYSQEKENYYENIGFIFQQVELYLQSNGIGCCWIGMGSPKNYTNKYEDQKFIITISFGKSDNDIYRDIDEFNRKRLDEISDKYDERLDVARLAPSAINSQPWYFTHNGDDSYNIYRKKHNLIKRRLLEKWNQIDIGIALAHLYISNKDTFEFYTEDDYKELSGYIYEGSFKI